MKRFAIIWLAIILLATTFVAAQASALPNAGRYNTDEYIDINKSKLTLKKGQSETLKATLMPGGKSVSVKWTSSNPNIVKVSSSGKITAVAQGKVHIIASASNYYDGYCTVTVKGGSKDPKLIGKDDFVFYYGKIKLRTEEAKDKDLYSKILKLISGGYKFTDKIYDSDFRLLGLTYGSNNRDKAHTIFWFDSISNDFAYYGGFHTFFATSNSPVKTSRGIVIGSKKSTVKAQYGLPTFIKQGTYNGKNYEYYYYEGSYLYILFAFQKSKDTVDYMSYSYQNSWIHCEIASDWFMSFYNGKLQ